MLLSSSLAVVGLCIDLGDDDVRVVDKVVGDLLPDGSEGFAVCTI